jgi:hypothetical protein
MGTSSSSTASGMFIVEEQPVKVRHTRCNDAGKAPVQEYVIYFKATRIKSGLIVLILRVES